MNRKDRDWLEHLTEILMSQINPHGISNLTQDHYDRRIEEGRSGSKLVSAHLDHPHLLELGFEVESSYGGKSQVSLGGQDIGGHDDHYTCYFQFRDLGKVMGPDFHSLGKNVQKQVLKKVIDQCDVQVHCNCPSYYWQGMNEDMASVGGDIAKFRGTKGTGIWRGRHQASGGLANPKIRVCKHLFQISAEISYWIKDINDMLAGTVAPRASESGNVVRGEKPERKPKTGTTVSVEPEESETKADVVDEFVRENPPEEVDSRNEDVGRDDTGHQQDIVDEKAGDEDEILEKDTTVGDVQPEDAVDVLENSEDTLLDSPLDDDEEEAEDR